LADGLAQGDHPKKIARALTATVEGISRKRAIVLARTEVIHAHAEGQLDGFEELGIDELGMLAEWSIADDGACPLCRPRAGQVYTVAEARGLIPLHPGCRCAWVPSVAGKPKRQIWAKPGKVRP
jgi:SPP1 gp7 family putative phage head morphogenesis protein